MGDRRVGYLAGLSYSNNQEIKLDQVRAKYGAGNVERDRYEGSEGTTSVLWGGLANVSLLLGTHSQIHFNNTFSRSADNSAGVNGVGKTTTIGKLAAQYLAAGKKVLLVAGDTFRAAAVEQIEAWGRRVGVEVIKHRPGADPSAVVYDGMQAAKSRGVDVLLIDTAGRLHTKVHLIEELKKIRRVIARELPDAPHETLLVLDATTGQNGLQQARVFKEATDISGIVLTKLDGTAKGGVIIGIQEELGVPVRYIGVGEEVDDLQPFDASLFVQALFEK
jgi:fused signal recognition particle receptor